MSIFHTFGYGDIQHPALSLLAPYTTANNEGALFDFADTMLVADETGERTVLEVSWAVVGAFWAILGCPRVLGSVLGPLRDVFGGLGDVLGAAWEFLGAS